LVLLFGTSTNLVMSSAMRQAGLGGLGVTELAPVALPLVLLGFAYLFWAGPRFLQGPGSGPEAAHGSTRAYLTEMCPGPRSRWLGQAPEALTRAVGVRAVGVIPASGQRGAGGIVPGDRLVVEAVREVIVGLLNQTDLGIGPGVDASEVDEPANSVLVEALIPLGSPLVGRSLREMRVPQRHGLATIALHRRPGLQRLMKLQLFGRVRGNPSLSDLPLSAGDVLLLRGAREHVARLDDGSTLLVLSDVKLTPPRYRKALTALFIFGAALAVATLGLLPLPIAGLSGLLAMVATGCVDPRAAFRIDWPVLVMIASMMALGLAMEKSGAARIMGERLAHLGSVAGPRGVLFALLLLTSTLSIPMSNQAAALVVFPIALSAAAQLGVDPRPLAIGVTLAASYSFATPLEPSCVLVYGAGHYRFSDFLRMGAPLTAGLLLALTWAVPTFWPF
ncbi:MAG TPA: SLC13 family permease, partial [Myxococcaceae bacterium]|nr:SLC13 family permease [Myxococcaceae bacterium]